MLISEAFYLLEIVLQFFTAYKDSENFENVYSMKKIAKEYIFNGSFIIHFISILPWTLLIDWRDANGKVDVAKEDQVRQLLLFKMLRIIHIMNIQDALPEDLVLRVFQYFYGQADRDEKIATDRTVLNICRIFKSVLMTIIITYILGLIWFRLSDNWQLIFIDDVDERNKLQ